MPSNGPRREALVRAREYAGFWKDAGQVDDALECNRRLLSELSPSVAGDHARVEIAA